MTRLTDATCKKIVKQHIQDGRTLARNDFLKKAAAFFAKEID